MKKTLSIATILLTVLAILSILIFQAKSGSDIQLTTNPYGDLAPEWSPDGVKIVYFAFSGSWYRHIWIMNNDGSSKTQLTSGSFVDARPAYSPDGSKIAFHRHGFRGDRHDLMIMDADGSNVQRLTFGGIPDMIEGSYEQPRWSEDGTKLIFQYNEGTTGGPSAGWWVCTINVDGTRLEVLRRGMAPRFCYGDTKIIFKTDPYYEHGQCIALMNADGTDMHLLTDGPNDRLPHMSSTTNRILFTRDEDLYVMNENGSNLVPITGDGTNNYATWSPDEKYIAYSSGKSGNPDIWKMEAPLPPVLTASVDVDPDTLNLKSEGKWITAYIQLPENYNVSDIDVSSIKLNNTIAAETHPTGVGDDDSDGIPDLMVKFNKGAIIYYIEQNIDWSTPERTKPLIYAVNLTVTGSLNDGTPFEGTDTIRVLKFLKGHPPPI